MKKYFLIVAGIFVVLNCLAQRPAQGPMSQKRYSAKKLGYKLVWEDQFNGNKLDTTKWKVRGVGPRALAYVSEEAVKVEDGYLKLYALKKGDSLLGSAVGTQGLFMSKYGYYECRAQLQKSPGVWAAFWIQSTEISKGEDPAKYGAEIDIFEFHNVHWAYGPHQQTIHGLQSYLKGLSEGFHLFGLEWMPGKYIFYVDGYKFYEVTEGISDIEEYMILSMEYPSVLEEISKTIFPDVFIVDYVKVYKKK